MATKRTTAPTSASLQKASTKASMSVAVKAPPSKANIVSIQDALKAQVAGLANRVAPASGNKIRITQDKKFVLPDGSKSDGPLELVIVDFTTTHNFYAQAFDKDNIVPPACFAIGSDPRNMAPSPNAPEPQSDNCQSCPMNQYGSDGKGKACKNGRLLAVLPPDADADTPMWTLAVSPTALKPFDGYVQAVARTFGMPPVSVVTTVSFNNSATYAQLQFSNPVPNANLAESFNRQAEAKDMLAIEPDVSGYEKPAAKPARKVAARR